ncbi:MAG TPA: MFS transporter, partial [Flavitalea sp.]|nr:MFS transporter [Flavitalea sp.]
VYLPVAVRELLGETTTELNSISGYINALFIFGWAFGGFTWGVIGDALGRKKSLLFAITCYGIFTLLTGAMTSWWGVMMCRLMSGFGVGGVAVASYTLLSEVWPQKSKPIFIGILSIAFPVGIFSAGLINYIVSSWREGFMVGVIPIVLALVGAFIIKESDKWIADKNDHSERANTFRTMFSATHRKDVISSSLIYGTMLISLWAIFSWLPTWVQSLITSADAQKERATSMMLLGMGGLTGGFLSGWIVKAIGIHKSMTIGFATCAVLSFILFKSNSVFSPIIYLEIGVLSIFFGLNMGIMSSYIPQLFPTQIRATATGFSLNIGRVFTGLGVLFVGVLVTLMGGYGNALLTFSMIFVCGLIVVLFVKPNNKPG